ncbi:hypothetical protein PDJAM_G00078890 [Pangasius djambal]|uniref:Uncharacterized protein n=1 Tax=Pangasius djambal TaxID=1691987 RepID=A0ACC5Z2T6_9TELE|nr:hypothetical protein [Pangasius djambal]
MSLVSSFQDCVCDFPPTARSDLHSPAPLSAAALRFCGSAVVLTAPYSTLRTLKCPSAGRRRRLGHAFPRLWRSSVTHSLQVTEVPGGDDASETAM